jgi:CubicO group peptidase (beta-lactamase class C family)
MTLINRFSSLLLLVLPLSLFAQSNAALSAKIDAYLNEKFPSTEPGGSVLVAKGEEIIFRKAYGLADEKLKQANTPETIFRIGSITKQFTSTAILKLVAEGKISLEDPITKFLPDYPMGEKTITIQHLLTHTSGIKSYTSLPEVVGSKESKERTYTVEEAINTFKSKPIDFAPGSNYLYNNSGYFLLGAIIEKISGKPWGNYVQENLFTPLGMKSSFTNDSGIAGEATGYYKRKDNYTEADIVHPSVSFSAGAIASTVDDLFKWNTALFSGKVISLDLLQKGWVPVALNDGTTRPYGFGWQFKELGKSKVIGHGGTIDGFQSYAWFVPDTKVFVVVLSNNMGSSPLEYTNKILDLINGNENALVKVEHKEIEMNPDTFSRFEGDYEFVPNFVINIKRDQQKLLAQATGQPAAQIFPESENKFFYKVVDAQLEFGVDESGKISSVTLFQNGNRMMGKKK